MPELQGEYVPGVPHYGPGGQRRWIVLVVAWMTTLAGMTVILRFISRRMRKQKLWVDDYLIMFSVAWNWAVVGVGFAMFIEGVGNHAKDLEPKAVENISMWLLVTEVIYVWNLVWTKLSLLSMYYRIFHLPYFKKLVFTVGGFVVAWGITVSFLFTFICVPVQKLWRPDLPGHCVSELGVWLANASCTIFTDIVILILPIPQVWKLQLRMIEKIGLTMVFGLGFFAVFASSFRTWVLFNYSKQDIPYTLGPLLVWSDIEMSVGIISACLPTLLPVTTWALGKLGINRFLGSSRSNDRSDQPENSGRKGSEPFAKARDANAASPSLPEVARHSSSRNAFYGIPDASDSDRILVQMPESRLHGYRSDTKMTFYKASSVETDGYSGRSEGMFDDVPLQHLR